MALNTEEATLSDFSWDGKEFKPPDDCDESSDDYLQSIKDKNEGWNRKSFSKVRTQEVKKKMPE